MYLDASQSTEGQTAKLESPTFKPTWKEEECQISFGFHMYGKAMGSLKVGVENTLTKKSTVIFSRSGDQGNRWFWPHVPVPSSMLSSDFKVRIQYSGQRHGRNRCELKLYSLFLCRLFSLLSGAAIGRLTSPSMPSDLEMVVAIVRTRCRRLVALLDLCLFCRFICL